MKFSNILLATTAALAGTAQADECVTGLLYCGETLLEMLGMLPMTWPVSCLHIIISH